MTAAAVGVVAMVLVTGFFCLGVFGATTLGTFEVLAVAPVTAFDVLTDGLDLVDLLVSAAAFALLSVVFVTGAGSVITLAAPGVGVRLQYQWPLANPQARPSLAVP